MAPESLIVHRPPRRRLRGWLPAAHLAAILLLSGCYSLVPVAMDSAGPPMRVTVHLSPAGAERIAPIVGEGRTTLTGRFVERTSEGIFVEVRSADIQQGFGTQALSQLILIAPADVVALQRRQLDRTQTSLVVGAGAALVGAVLFDMLNGESGGSSPPGGGGPPEVRFPLITIPVR